MPHQHLGLKRRTISGIIILILRHLRNGQKRRLTFGTQIIIMRLINLMLKLRKRMRLRNGNQVVFKMEIMWELMLHRKKTFGIRRAEWRIRMSKREMRKKKMSTVKTSLQQTPTSNKRSKILNLRA